MSDENDPNVSDTAVKVILGREQVERADKWKYGKRVAIPHTGGTFRIEPGAWAFIVTRDGIVTQYVPSDYEDIPLVQHAGIMSAMAVAVQYTEDMLINVHLEEELEELEENEEIQ